MQSTFSFLTFEQWKAENKDIEEGEAEECEECLGTGVHECSCGDKHPCGACEGEGKLREGPTLNELYKTQLKRDKAALDKWLETVVP